MKTEQSLAEIIQQLEREADPGDDIARLESVLSRRADPEATTRTGQPGSLGELRRVVFELREQLARVCEGQQQLAEQLELLRLALQDSLDEPLDTGRVLLSPGPGIDQ